MKIIRWFFSHILLILLIVAVIYGYMFWGNLAGNDTPVGKALAYLSNEFEEVGEFVAAIKAKQEKLSQQEPSAVQSPAAHQPFPEYNVSEVTGSVDSGTATQLAEAPVTETQAVEVTTENNSFAAPVANSSSTASAAINDRSEAISENKDIEQQQISVAYNQNNTTTKQNAAGIVEPVDEVVANNIRSQGEPGKTQFISDRVVTEGATKDSFVSTEIEKQLDNVDKSGRLIDDSQQGDPIRTSWIAARKSFYQRKYDESEQNYQYVIDNTEDNFDAYGELGNVYFNQGKNVQAASAYFEAAAILVRKGQVNRARSLMGLLRHLDKSKASELQKLLDSVVSEI
jgi:tetratricopeptide (TPR) repeat protein